MTPKNDATNERISIRPDVLVGKPVIRGTRIPVYLIMNLLAHGYDVDRIVRDYPILTSEDVAAAVQYANEHLERVAR